jgi:phage I-like protein
MIMNCLILNRDYRLPEDGWHQVAPAGEHAHPPSGLVQVIDTTALESMVRMFRQEAQQAQFPGLLVDYDHFSEDTAKPSEAAGWITELEGRADGLWARIRWSDSGEAAVKGGRYRLVSPVWLAADVQRIDDRRIRPLRLHRAALTNSPNLKGMTPLSNRVEGEQRQPAEAEALPHQDTQAQRQPDNAGQAEAIPILTPNTSDNNETKGTMKEIALALGLAPDATLETALAAVETLRQRAQTAEAEAAPLKNRLASLEQSAARWREEQAEADLVRCQDRFAPSARDKWKAALMANREGALELLESLPASAPVHQRSQARIPQAGRHDRELSRSIREYQNRHQCRWQEAWDGVREERPELFGKALENA